MTQPLFRKVAIIGVGLIGGSFALALRAADAAEEIVGVDRDSVNLQRALQRRVVARAESDPADAVRDADLVFLAMPVGQMKTVMQLVAPHLNADAIITDTGSSKQDVVLLARQYLPEHLARFVPGHPIAGAEQSGVDAADGELFRGRNLVLTPIAETSADAINKVTSAWALCGATVRRMSAATHDRIFAAVSHLPHVLAFALVEELAGRADAEELFRYAAGGFRDFTRIASSSPEMWRDICLANRDSLAAELEVYGTQLETLRRLVLTGDSAALQALFERARVARNAWLAAGSGTE